LFGEKKHKLSSSTFNVYRAICSRWPTNPVEVARELGDNGENVKTLSGKYLYHFRKLYNLELIQMKRVGNTYVVWPNDIEKLRVIHELVREGD
jgi:predicted transcriptional regulator